MSGLVDQRLKAVRAYFCWLAVFLLVGGGLTAIVLLALAQGVQGTMFRYVGF